MGSTMVSARAPTTMISAALACCSMYGTGSARAERHSTDVARFSTAARNSASSSDNRFWMAAASSSRSFCAKSPSAKYIGGLRSDAATPTTRAPNRSARSPATLRQASLGRSNARPTMTVL